MIHLMSRLTKKWLHLAVLVDLILAPAVYAGKCSVCHEEIVPGLEVSGAPDAEIHAACASGDLFWHGVPSLVSARISRNPPTLAALTGAELAQEVAADLEVDFPGIFSKPSESTSVSAAGGGAGGGGMSRLKSGKPRRRVSWNEGSFLSSVRDFKIEAEHERVAQAKILLSKTKVKPVNSSRPKIQKRVSKRFAALGPMHQFKATGGCILVISAPAPRLMSQAEAVQFFRDLGQGSRLPTPQDYEDFANALFQGPEEGYGFNLIPDLVSPDHQYWTAPAAFGNPTVYAFDWVDDADEVEAYSLEVGDDGDDYAVRCVIER